MDGHSGNISALHKSGGVAALLHLMKQVPAIAACLMHMPAVNI